MAPPNSTPKKPSYDAGSNRVVECLYIIQPEGMLRKSLILEKRLIIDVKIKRCLNNQRVAQRHPALSRSVISLDEMAVIASRHLVFDGEVSECHVGHAANDMLRRALSDGCHSYSPGNRK